MDISIKLGLTKGDSNVKALATVTIDNQFAIHGLKVVEGKKGDFIAYPSQKKADGSYADVAHPVTAEARQAVNDAVIAAYDKAREKAAEVAKEDVEPER